MASHSEHMSGEHSKLGLQRKSEKMQKNRMSAHELNGQRLILTNHFRDNPQLGATLMICNM